MGGNASEIVTGSNYVAQHRGKDGATGGFLCLLKTWQRFLTLAFKDITGISVYR